VIEAYAIKQARQHIAVHVCWLRALGLSLSAGRQCPALCWP
jgi:hypothetical protein